MIQILIKINTTQLQFRTTLSYGIDCYTCSTENKSCNGTIETCQRNIRSCFKATIEKSQHVAKGCHAIPFEESNACYPTTLHNGPLTGSGTRCLCSAYIFLASFGLRSIIS
ncbi:unnamed protein product [Lepeophtheirus salmonis]|uniref:(salmon louse) hypothetical protein n=1 Tax=Lepeophtheirus salmonis TaxID=72036 RepID=A0A7R8D150_LEPSM|nr:unnamed protein product [Lepeophtheirus salmonis]CAF2992434.1 unnamed protein product [Lepeophtheirus salmonis]